jgi:hypothetical protein
MSLLTSFMREILRRRGVLGGHVAMVGRSSGMFLRVVGLSGVKVEGRLMMFLRCGMMVGGRLKVRFAGGMLGHLGHLWCSWMMICDVQTQ